MDMWCRNRLQKERDRDVSEKIALGLPNTGAARDDVQFDQRLFNQSRVGVCVYILLSLYCTVIVCHLMCTISISSASWAQHLLV